ncbi:methyltransferase domain-containing protein [Thermoproteota archaeon]
MNPEEDAWGQLILAQYEGKKSYEAIERDDGFLDVSLNPQRYFSTFDEWNIHTQESMQQVKGTVLDIGCGAGRHALYLQDKGLDVLGIDNSPLAIKVCQLRGLKKTKVTSIDELSFDTGSFDTILMLGNNFGLFGSFNKAKELLMRFHSFASDDCLIIAETLDPYKTDNPVHLKYHELNLSRGRMGGQIRFRIRYGIFTTPWFDYLFVSKDEMSEILNGTGWRVREFIESESVSYIALIEKYHLA